jgi:hypothetical protein
MAPQLASTAPLPAELSPYVKQLCYFLSYFPDKLVSIGLMHELQQLKDALRKRLQPGTGAAAGPSVRDVTSRQYPPRESQGRL